MVEFIDKTSTQSGTKINRKNLMGAQGFVKSSITFPGNGKIVETNDDGSTTTTTFSENMINEEYTGQKKITKITTIDFENSIIGVELQ